MHQPNCPSMPGRMTRSWLKSSEVCRTSELSAQAQQCARTQIASEYVRRDSSTSVIQSCIYFILFHCLLSFSRKLLLVRWVIYCRVGSRCTYSCRLPDPPSLALSSFQRTQQPTRPFCWKCEIWPGRNSTRGLTVKSYNQSNWKRLGDRLATQDKASISGWD
jgi:hypothetical protein